MWDGTERRKERVVVVHDCKFEDRIIELISTTKSTNEKITALDKRINGAFTIYSDHIEDGKGWQKIVVVGIITLVLQIIVFATLWGSMQMRVNVNTVRLDKIEEANALPKLSR